MAKLTPMARTAQEKAEIVKQSDPATTDSVSEYPWGLSLCLNEDSLEKLGVTDLPKPGTEVTIMAKARVTGVRMSADEGDNIDRQGVDLQITDMSFDAGAAGKAARSLYSSAAQEDDE